MTEFSKIEWCDHTFNPWWGCVRVSPACRFCYADSQARRYGHEVWRKRGPRRMLSDANWAKPLKWNRDAERAGIPAKVFCASMADVFEDHPDVAEPRERLWEVIDATPWLRWQLLTKRPENVAGMAPWSDDWPDSVWLGTSVETQQFADQRIPILLKVPAKVRFLSCEPLLGPVDLRLTGTTPSLLADEETVTWRRDITWVIAGGESGAKARPTELKWVRSLVQQCRNAGSAPFVKQLGTAWAKDVHVGGRSLFSLGDRKGGDPAYWPRDLRVREFPRTAVEVSP
jgi:protein gp37